MSLLISKQKQLASPSATTAFTQILPFGHLLEYLWAESKEAGFKNITALWKSFASILKQSVLLHFTDNKLFKIRNYSTPTCTQGKQKTT